MLLLEGDVVVTSIPTYKTQTCRWGVHEQEPQFQASFENHNDWVNDLAVIEDVLVSCSSDATVQFWKANSEGMLQLAELQQFELKSLHACVLKGIPVGVC